MNLFKTIRKPLLYLGADLVMVHSSPKPKQVQAQLIVGDFGDDTAWLIVLS